MKNPLITITYTLFNGQSIQIDVSPEVAAVLDETDRKMLALLKQDKRHLDLYGYTEGETEPPVSCQQENIVDLIEQRDEYNRLHYAINQLTEPQRRRIKAHFFDELSFVKIAAIEEVDESAVRRSIGAGLKKLKSQL